MQNILKNLHKTHCIEAKMPMFTLNSGQIEILNKPIDFYINLHVRNLYIYIYINIQFQKGIKESQNRIIFNSLYIGDGNLEKFLIESLTNHLHKFE